MLIRAITTNKGKTLNKYTIYFFDGTCLVLSANADSQQGISQWSEYYGINDSHFEEASESKKHVVPGTDETMINFYCLPHIIQAHIEKRIAGV